MAIEKRENVFVSLAISATPIVNELAEIEYVLNNTLQTGTVYVDTETNNLVGSVIPNPAYQQPDEVVRQYLGDAMASLVTAVDQEKANAKQAAEKAAADLQAEKDARAAAEQAKAALHTAEIQALRAAADKARDEQQAAHEAAIKAKDEAHVAAIKAKDEAHASILQQVRGKAADDLAANNATHESQVNGLKAAIASLEAKVSEQQTYIEAVSGLEKAKEMAAALQAAKEAEQIAELEAKLAELKTANARPVSPVA
jgi:hypothetical protein